MKYGLFTCPYQRLTLEKAFADAADFGYDYIELWGGRPHAYAPDLLRGEISDVQRLIERYEIPVEIYTPEHNAYPFNYMIGSESQWEDSIAYLKSAISCGKALNAQYTLISVGHSGSASPFERRKRLVKSLNTLSEEAQRLNHKIVVEPLTPLESDCCNTSKELAEILDEINSPAIFGMCDVVVPFVMGRNLADEIRALKPRMAHLHIADSDGKSETHLLPGEGIMDFREMFNELRLTGYDGCATLELVTHYMDDPSSAAKSIIQRIKEADEN